MQAACIKWQLACSKAVGQVADVGLLGDCSPRKDDEAAQGAVRRDLNGLAADRVDDRHRQAVAARARECSAQVMLLPRVALLRVGMLAEHDTQAWLRDAGCADGARECGTLTCTSAWEQSLAP